MRLSVYDSVARDPTIKVENHVRESRDRIPGILCFYCYVGILFEVKGRTMAELQPNLKLL